MFLSLFLIFFCVGCCWGVLGGMWILEGGAFGTSEEKDLG